MAARKRTTTTTKTKARTFSTRTAAERAKRDAADRNAHRRKPRASAKGAAVSDSFQGLMDGLVNGLSIESAAQAVAATANGTRGGRRPAGARAATGARRVMLDREGLRAAEAVMLEAITAALTPLGLMAKVARGEYSRDGLTGAVKFALAHIPKAGELAETRETAAWRMFALVLKGEGIDPAWLGRTFDNRGRVHRIIGYRPGASRKPILTSDGRQQYVWPLASIAQIMRGAAK